MAKVAYIGKTEFVDRETLVKLFPETKCFICDDCHDIETPCPVVIQNNEETLMRDAE